MDKKTIDNSIEWLSFVTHGDNMNFVPQRSKRFGGFSRPNVLGEVSVDHVANPHSPATTASTTTMQMRASTAQMRTTTWVSVSLPVRMTMCVRDWIGPL